MLLPLIVLAFGGPKKALRKRSRYLSYYSLTSLDYIKVHSKAVTNLFLNENTVKKRRATQLPLRLESNIID